MASGGVRLGEVCVGSSLSCGRAPFNLLLIYLFYWSLIPHDDDAGFFRSLAYKKPAHALARGFFGIPGD